MASIHPLADIAEHQTDAEAALRLLFSPDNPNYTARFATYLPQEIADELEQRLRETDFQSSLTVLARVEAVLRVDYRKRCRLKKADSVSIAFRKLNRRVAERARLEDDILHTWYGSVDPAGGAVIRDLRRMFKFRHWLAHGRYWNFAPAYSFQEVYLIANAVVTGLPLYT